MMFDTITPVGSTHAAIVIDAFRRHGHDAVAAVVRQHGYRTFREWPPERRYEAIDQICRLDGVRPAFEADYPAGSFAVSMESFFLRAGETLEVGDVVCFDRDTGKLRKCLPGDEGHRFTIPPGSRVTADGYLEMPR